MKKILLSVVAVAAIAVGYQKYNQSNAMSDLMLANVEALANGESGDKWWCCSSSESCHMDNSGYIVKGTFKVTPC